MKHSFQLMLTLTLLFSTSFSLAKPRTVSLDKELRNALYFDYVEVMGYTDSTILFKEIEGYDGYYTTEWMDSENFKLLAKNDTAWLSADIKFSPIKNAGNQKYTTGYVPLKGEKVLIVLNKKHQVSIFAHLEDDKYRFWSPFFTGSVALFQFNAPATKIPGKKGLAFDVKDYETCYQGCILPKADLITYPYQDQTQKYKGTTQMNDGRALFIYEFAFSEPYFLYGVDNWEEEYLNKTITVEGVLVQFVNGKSMILNWEIIKVKDSK